jgi:hypothetical protein
MKKTKEEKKIEVYLERQFTNHICYEMKLNSLPPILRVFEKDLRGYEYDEPIRVADGKHFDNRNFGVIEFEITDRYLFGRRIYRETINQTLNERK